MCSVDKGKYISRPSLGCGVTIGGVFISSHAVAPSNVHQAPPNVCVCHSATMQGGYHRKTTLNHAALLLMRKGVSPSFLAFSKSQTRPASEDIGSLLPTCLAPGTLITSVAGSLLFGEHEPVPSHAAGVRVRVVVELGASGRFGEDAVRHQPDEEASHTSVSSIDCRVLQSPRRV